MHVVRDIIMQNKTKTFQNKNNQISNQLEHIKMKIAQIFNLRIEITKVYRI